MSEYERLKAQMDEIETQKAKSAATRAAKRLHLAGIIGRSQIYPATDVIAQAILDDEHNPHDGALKSRTP